MEDARLAPSQVGVFRLLRGRHVLKRTSVRFFSGQRDRLVQRHGTALRS
jgi:hypothetical protein